MMTNRREFIKGFLIAGGAAVVTSGLMSGTSSVEVLAHALETRSASDAAWGQLKGILKRIKPPVFPKRDFMITRYGAVGNGTTDCTQAFRQAISACNKAGGGRIVVPAGSFLTGPIHLKSNVNPSRNSVGDNQI